MTYQSCLVLYSISIDMSDSYVKPAIKPWDGCPYCKELFGQVYREHIKLADVVTASTSCTRCCALVEILRRVTDVSNTVTILVGSIWHNNTLHIGVISPGHTFETAPGYEIYIDDGDNFDYMRSSSQQQSYSTLIQTGQITSREQMPCSGSLSCPKSSAECTTNLARSSKPPSVVSP